MLRFKRYSLLTCGFGEGADMPIGALSKPATKATTESGSTLSRADFIGWHTESGKPKYNKKSEHGGYSFYNSYEK
jgi:hypothetical protein